MKYAPDFQCECRICGNSPCVIVTTHSQPGTELCGGCFFHDRNMLNPEEWNEQELEDSININLEDLE